MAGTNYSDPILQVIREPLIILNNNLEIIQVNFSFCRTFAESKDEIMGKRLLHLPQWEIPELKNLINDVVLYKKQFENIEITHIFPKVGEKNLLINAQFIKATAESQASVLLAIEDISARKIIEARLKDREEWFRSLIINSSDIIAVLTPEGDITYESPSIEMILGYKAEERIGVNIFQKPIVHPDDFTVLKKLLDQTLKNPERMIKGEVRFQAKSGEWKFLDAVFRNKLNDSKIAGIIVNYRDVTERKYNENKISFLAEAGRILSSSLDYKTTLNNIANNAVPQIADWCVIRMANKEGFLEPLVVVHKDPEKRKWATDLALKSPVDTTQGSYKVMQTGKAEMVGKLPSIDELAARYKLDDNSRKLLTELNLYSYIIVPIKIGPKSIGIITLATDDSRREYTKNDLVLAEELSARAALAIENSQLFQEAQQAIKLRDDFINIASHELRTPVTSIKAYTQILVKKLSGFEDKSLFKMIISINHQITRLTELISSLLDATRIQSGKLTLQEEEFEVDEFIKKIVSDFKVTDPLVMFSLTGKTGKKVKGDRYRLEQVIVNIITNAIKYANNDKRIKINLKLSNTDAIISIRDFGIGIAQENLEKIFDRFFSIDSPLRKTGNISSLGLGLWICRQIITRHNGKIWAESEVGKGSTFYVSIPLKK